MYHRKRLHQTIMFILIIFLFIPSMVLGADANHLNRTPLIQNDVPASESSETITVIVELQSVPLSVYESHGQQGVGKINSSYKEQLEKEQNEFKTTAQQKNIQIIREYKHLFNGYSIDLPANKVEDVLSLPGVKAIYPNLSVMNPPVLPQTAHLEEYNSNDESISNYGSSLFWELGYDGSGIKIGILDSGIDDQQPNLPGRIQGIAPGAELYTYQVLGAQGTVTVADVLAGIERSGIDGMDVMYLSVQPDTLGYPDPIDIALQNAMQAGIVAITSSTVFVGEDFPAFTDLPGPSSSSPYVAGAVALLLERDPSLKPSEIKALLMNNAQKLSDPTGLRYSHLTQGAGRMDMENILAAQAVVLVEENTLSASGQPYTYHTGSISFRQVKAGSTATRQLVLKNLVGDASTYTVETIWYGQGAGSLSANVGKLEVQGNEATAFQVTLTVDTDLAEGYYEGEVSLADERGHLLQIPVAVHVVKES